MRLKFAPGGKCQGRDVIAVFHGENETVVLVRHEDERFYAVQLWRRARTTPAKYRYRLSWEDASSEFNERVAEVMNRLSYVEAS